MKHLGQNIWVKFKQWLGVIWFPLLAACLSFALLQIDGVERSFLGAPDREMLQAAFKLRDGVARGSGDPVLWLDIDYETLTAHAQAAGRASPLSGYNREGPSAIIPRGIVASALAYARKPDVTMVVLDIDLAWGSHDPVGEGQLLRELTAWSGDPEAPLLVLAREVISLPTGLIVMPTRFDDLVSKAPNIAFGGVSMLSGGGGVREFVAGQCVQIGDQKTVYLPSAVSFAQAAQAAYRVKGAGVSGYAARIKTSVSGQQVSNSLTCSQRSSSAKHNGVVSWHIGYSYPQTIRAAHVSETWPHQSLCQLSGPPQNATRIGVADILSDPKGASAAPLCRRLVIIGADNPIVKDRTATPIGILPGPIILANAMRGHYDTGPIVRENWNLVRLGLQVLLLIITVICIVWAFDGVAKLRLRLLAIARPSAWQRVALSLTHPLSFKFIVAFVTFGFGVLITAMSLELGFWGLLSAPAYLATLFEAGRQINVDRRKNSQDQVMVP